MMDGRSQVGFLPDFCALPAVFVLVVGCQMLAFVLVLSPLGSASPSWSQLAMTSLFVQVIGITLAAILCAGRVWLAELAIPTCVGFALILTAVVTACATVIAFLTDSWLMSDVLGGASPPGGAWYLQSAHDAELRAVGSHLLPLVGRNVAIGLICAAIALRYFYVQHLQRRQHEREVEARVQALQSRIRPHFLFNSMNTIASLTRSNPEGAEDMVLDLAEMFRASLTDARLLKPLADEFELCRRYLNIEQNRLGGRLRVQWELAPGMEQSRLPPLTLQPLVENAIYHGIEPDPDGGDLRIAAEVDDAGVSVAIENSLSDGAAEREGNRIAQDNVQQRLSAFFGERGRLEVTPDATSSAGKPCYRVVVRFPLSGQTEA
jgi:two-component system sensor histidine kinase AlgZ